MFYLIRGPGDTWYTKRQTKDPIHFPNVELAIQSLESYSGFNVSEKEIDKAIIDIFAYDKNVVRFTTGTQNNQGKYAGYFKVDLNKENWGQDVDKG